VLSVHPGGIKTNIARNARYSEDNQKFVKRFEEKLTPTTPEEAAEVIVQGIIQKKRRVLIGKDAKRMNRFRTLYPKAIWKAASKGVK